MSVNDKNLTKAQEEDNRAAATWPMELQYLTKYFVGQRYTDEIKSKLFKPEDVKNDDKLAHDVFMELAANGVAADQDLREYATLWLQSFIEKKNLGELVYMYRPSYEMFVRTAMRHLQAAYEMNEFNVRFNTEFAAGHLDDVAEETISMMEREIESLKSQLAQSRDERRDVKLSADSHMPSGPARLLTDEVHDDDRRTRGDRRQERQSREERSGRNGR